MSVFEITTGQLSDGRVQLFAWGGEGGQTSLWSCWKTGVNADTLFTKWSPFDMDGFSSIAPGTATRQGNGSLQLFFLASGPLPVDVVGGPDVATTWKVGADIPSSAWAPWQIFYAAQYGPPGSGTTGVNSIASAILPDGRLQVFMQVDGTLQTAWQESVGGGWVDARPFTPQPPETLASLTAAPLSDGRIQLWGVGAQDIWSTWKVGTGANDAWHEWSKFQSINFSIAYNAPSALTVGRQADGRLQLWTSASEVGGPGWVVFSCLKTSSTDSNSAWTPWTQFFDTEQYFDQGIQRFAVAPLSDGRLQLWGIDGNWNLFSTWQLTENTQDWNHWTIFPSP